MARVKGATEADQAAHTLFDKNLVRHKFDIVCRACHKPLEVAYHEEMLYSVSCPCCKKITLRKAWSPAEAARNSGGCTRKAEG